VSKFCRIISIDFLRPISKLFFFVAATGASEERQPAATRRERGAHQGHLQAVKVIRKTGSSGKKPDLPGENRIFREKPDFPERKKKPRSVRRKWKSGTKVFKGKNLELIPRSSFSLLLLHICKFIASFAQPPRPPPLSSMSFFIVLPFFQSVLYSTSLAFFKRTRGWMPLVLYIVGTYSWYYHYSIKIKH
jgi:hypothetical protein